MVGSHSLEGFFRAAGGPFFHLGTIVNDLAAPTYAFVPRRGRCLIEQTNDKGCAQCARSLQELFVKQGTRSVFKRRTFSVVDSPMVELRCGGMCFATPDHATVGCISRIHQQREDHQTMPVLTGRMLLF